jgi:hypothetical protein
MEPSRKPTIVRKDWLAGANQVQFWRQALISQGLDKEQIREFCIEVSGGKDSADQCSYVELLEICDRLRRLWLHGHLIKFHPHHHP